jgi:hypothetical protein
VELNLFINSYSTVNDVYWVEHFYVEACPHNSKKKGTSQ